MTQQTEGPVVQAAPIALPVTILAPPPPVDNDHVAPGAERFTDPIAVLGLQPAKPRARTRRVALPNGKKATVYTRDQLVKLYACGHGELGRLLARKLAPLPVRIEGLIVWFADEVEEAAESVRHTLARWRQR